MGNSMKLIQKLTLHLNRGRFQDSHYKILAVTPTGEEIETGITRHVRVEVPSYSVDGRDDYRTLANELHFGTDTYDHLKQRHARQWIRRRLGKTPST